MTVNTKTIKWTGKSGNKYQYWIYSLDVTFSAEPGNYVFAQETKPGSWKPIYIGETSDLSERFDSHHKASCIQRHGVTTIHVQKNSATDDDSRNEESDLISHWNPTCNG